ncbi:MAG: hypothetical protein H0W83_05545 [Planctomycetes bacterium]|nr:hypothetical protein [Planctomycetota bacterium]
MTAIPIALVQFDAIPECAEANRAAMERLAARAVDLGARWILFHECSVCDYNPNLARFAEAVTHGPSTTRMTALAARLGCFIGFGLAEAAGGRRRPEACLVRTARIP